MKLSIIFTLLFLLTSYVSYAQFGNGTKSPSATAIQIMDNVLNADAGGMFTAVVKKDFSLWVTGKQIGELEGIDGQHYLTTFKKLDENVIEVKASWSNLFFKKKDNSLWGCGSNKYGQLGNSNFTDQLTPTRIFENVKSFSVGAGHLLIINNTNQLWAVGWNSSGQLGDGTFTNSFKPKLLLTDVAEVSAGQYQSFILKSDKSVWFCGSNLDLFTSMKPELNTNKYVKIFDNAIGIFSGYSINSVYVLLEDHSLYGWGLSFGVFFKKQAKQQSFVKLMDDVRKISIGESQILILKVDNSLWGSCTSINNYGLLGNGTKSKQNDPIKLRDNILDIHAGVYHSLIQNTNNELFASGFNGAGGMM